MADVRLDNVSRRFPGGVTALEEICLTVGDGELMAVVGPSGSGKTTLLRMVAGLDVPTSGRVCIGERDVTHVAAWRRQVALVAESAALLPHATARENVVVSLRRRRREGFWRSWRARGKDEDERLSTDMLHRLGLGHLGERRPAEWSAGEQQRVALGRALLAAPAVLLMDEPLGRVDGAMRGELARQIRRVQRERRTTCLYVTHDRQEAMNVADRVAVLHRGRLAQVGAPREIYSRPASRFVAEWSSDGRLGWLPPWWLAKRVGSGGVRRLEANGANSTPRLAAGVDEQRVAAGFRPDGARIATSSGRDAKSRRDEAVLNAEGTIDWIEVAGARNYVWVRLDERASADSLGHDGKQDVRETQDAEESAAVSEAARVVVETDGQFTARSGDRVRVEFDWRQVQWFEEDSGRTLTVWE